MFETGIIVQRGRLSMLWSGWWHIGNEMVIEIVLNFMKKLLREGFGLKINKSKIKVKKSSRNGSNDS